MYDKGITKAELKEMLEKNAYAFLWDETEDVFNITLTVFKSKWICENDNHTFDEPAWIETPTSENPICPKCESLNIDLTKSVVEFNPRAIIRIFGNKEEQQ